MQRQTDSKVDAHPPTPAGYAGKVLWVDLDSGRLREEPTAKWSEWIGGRGLAAFLLAFSPTLYADEPARQPIVIAAGPLVGVGLPMGVRTAVAARNQISGGYCYSNVGGDFGTRMKMAGYDAVAVAGASASPVCLLLGDDEPRLVPADDLWGLKIPQVQEALAATHGADPLSFIGIGPAGEREVTISCLMVDRAHAAGWGGSGAIFGAKKLKAIVALGERSVPVFDKAGLRTKTSQLGWRIGASEAMAGLVRGGTHGMAGAGGYSGLVPTGVRNLQDEYLTHEASAPIREEAFRQWEGERDGCVGCSIRCLHRYHMGSERYGTIESEGMHANSVRGLASNWGVDDAQDLLMAHTLCNQYGLDVDGVSAAVAFALECADNGLLEREQPDGVRLEWGNGPSLVKLVRQIGERADLGQLLGHGAWEAARQIGGDSQSLAVTTKHVGINEQGLRSHRAWALGVMTSTRGGGHLGGSPQTENRRISAEQGQRLLDNRHAGDPGSYQGKGELAAWTEGLKCAVDSLGLCYFVYGWYDLSLGNPDELAEMLQLATGIRLSGKELHRFGLRCHTLERYLSYRLGGHTRTDDTLPDRFFDTPVSGGAYGGAQLDRQRVEKALDEYYSYLGWDVETGLPSPEALRGLELAFLLKDE